MKAKDFLKDEATLNLSEIAKLMWPKNSNAIAYLSRKLTGNDPKRQWTAADEAKAIEVLAALKIRISDVVK